MTQTQKGDSVPAADAAKGPVKTFRIDDVSASVFAHQRKGGALYSVSFSRSYKDRAGVRKYVKFFGIEDFPAIGGVLKQADEYVRSLQHPETAK